MLILLIMVILFCIYVGLDITMHYINKTFTIRSWFGLMIVMLYMVMIVSAALMVYVSL